VTLHHRVTGTGMPLLLIHGTGATTDVWRAVTPVLSRSHQVIAYDRRGHGRSPGPPPAGRDAHGLHAEDAVELLRRVAAHEPALVVGASAGGIIALELATRHPERVRSLVLIEPPLWGRRHGGPRLSLAMLQVFWHAQRAPRRAAATFYRAVSRYHRGGGNGFDALDAAERGAILDNADAILAELRAGTGEQLTAARLARVACPVTLLLGGRSAPLFARIARDLARAVPQLRTAHVRDAGHLMMLEAPAALAAWINACDPCLPTSPAAQSC
jgi:pimeloyl-ACP methyl ester carboxylesterase